MRIQINIEKQYDEIEVHIYANEYNVQIEQLMKQLKKNEVNVIDGYRDNEIHMLKTNEIYCIYAEGIKVFFQTEEEEFESKRRVYELEQLLGDKFVRVNKSTLVNLSKITSIQLGPLGSTKLFLENEISIVVSRNYLKKLKHAVGIGGN
ncbi:LytTR family DNA-binding domain-containing protein [Lysinibacillus parviboronicapiens]|uniref:LytTR family DNA-binding domain-containing protein n=1 Tax=Lysinibacillus parviboronicapiens TaxID=436516 RepID=UPI000D363436|nr:LytTR family DNA-binding domain-containing protein [Lysinibacillus parviboronicapiens]